jgi:hypothetical protein
MIYLIRYLTHLNSGGTRMVITLNARLPNNLICKTMKNVPLKQWFWFVPWAMQADKKGSLWLDESATSYNKKMGTASMRVMRTEEGYIVDIEEVKDKKYNWELGGKEKPPVFGKIEAQYTGKVKRLITGPEDR